MIFTGTKWVKLLDLGVSQLYLNEQKIRQVNEWFLPNSIDNFMPLPVHDFKNGRYTLTDGHTRAYVAYTMGLEKIPVIYDKDNLITCQLGQILYKTDIEWCKRFNLNNISDLKDRIITNDDYKKLWLDRCNLAYNLFSLTTVVERQALQKQQENLYLFGASKNMKILYFENQKGEIFEFQNQYV